MSAATHRLWSLVTEARLRWTRPAPVAPGLRVLCYHSIGPGRGSDRYGLDVSPAVFRRQMELVASGRFGEPTTLGGARLDGSAELCVTFDDGYNDALGTAAPILAELGLPFTVCATATYVMNAVPGYLTPGGLKRLAETPGAEIGAHGSAHVALAELADDDLERELRVSKELLEQAAERPVTVMSWPHGSASRRARDFAARAGYKRAACSLYGVNERGRDPLLLKRVEITGFDDELDFVRKCEGAWDWYAKRQKDPVERA